MNTSQKNCASSKINTVIFIFSTNHQNIPLFRQLVSEVYSVVHPKRPRESSPAKFKIKFVLFLKSKEMVQARINLALHYGLAYI